MASQKSNIRSRLAALDAYGGECSCCSENRYEFLTIDHVNNDGASHRKEFGEAIGSWLKKNGYPAGFQVLCMNCNWAKGRYGECPHERERRKDVGFVCEELPWEPIRREMGI